MKLFSNFLKIAHLLSLDVAIGAMISSAMFWKISERINGIALLILGITTWLIYLLDRMLDVRKKQAIQTNRHQFHFQYKKAIFRLILVLFFTALIFVFFLPKQLIFFGFTVVVLVVIYLLILFFYAQVVDFQLFKEISVAIIYTISVVGSAYCMKKNITLKEWILGVNFLFIAIQNLVIFSLFEVRENKEQQNIVTKIGVQKSSQLIVFLFLIIAGSFVIFFDKNQYENKVFFTELIMSASLLIINYFSAFFLQHERYRYYGDGIFFLPLFIIFS